MAVIWRCATWAKLGPQWVRPWVVGSWGQKPSPVHESTRDRDQSSSPRAETLRRLYTIRTANKVFRPKSSRVLLSLPRRFPEDPSPYPPISCPFPNVRIAPRLLSGTGFNVPSPSLSGHPDRTSTFVGDWIQRPLSYPTQTFRSHHEFCRGLDPTSPLLSYPDVRIAPRLSSWISASILPPSNLYSSPPPPTNP